MRPLVLLGTGTNVGKTFVCAQLALALREAAPARSVVALKPVESGFSQAPGADLPPGSDAAQLAAVSTLPPPQPNPLYALPDPISPHLAARRAGVHIDLAKIRPWASSALHYDTLLLVETAGGVFSPLSDHTTNLDLARALEPAILVLVAPDSLGVLHDVTATLAALRATSRPPDHLILTAARDPDASTGTNAAELKRLGHPEPVSLPSNDPSPLRPLAARLWSLAAS